MNKSQLIHCYNILYPKLEHMKNSGFSSYIHFANSKLYTLKVCKIGMNKKTLMYSERKICQERLELELNIVEKFLLNHIKKEYKQ